MLLRHSLLFFAVAAAGAALDLWTKHLAFEHIQRFQEVTIIDGWFSFGRTTNPGVVFGMGGNAKIFWKFIAVAAVPVILIIFYTVRKPKWILTISLGMILAGTIGNMYDRVFTELHEVRDFIKFFYRPASGGEKVWPLFNLADAFICVGVFLLTIEMMFFDEKKKAPPQPAAPSPPPEKIEPPAPALRSPSPGGEEGPAGPVAGPGPVVEGK